jgi:hypothetical protein
MSYAGEGVITQQHVPIKQDTNPSSHCTEYAFGKTTLLCTHKVTSDMQEHLNTISEKWRQRLHVSFACVLTDSYCSSQHVMEAFMTN